MRLPRRPVCGWIAATALAAAVWGAGCLASEPDAGSDPEPTTEPDPPPAVPPRESLARVIAHGEAEAGVDGDAGFFEDLDEERDGAWLYERNCSGCHGPTGAGDGPTALELGVQPRNFNQGGFSFGNTREDLFRTLGSGIPGRSVMPSFKGVLRDEELWLIVDHVRTLTPPQEETDPRASVMTVGERPVVARGKLPPLAEGLPERPRGLLVGLPEGLTFEYDVEDVRLCAVRLGPFADREDWRARGGGYLRPLGQPVYSFGGGDPEPCFVERREAADVALRGLLTSTRVLADAVEVRCDLVDPAGRVRGTALETCRFVATGVGAAFRRTLQLSDPGEIRRQALRLAGSGEGPFELRGGPGGRTTWAVARRTDGSFECVRVDTAWPLEARADGSLWVEMEVGPWRVLSAEATVVLCDDGSDAKLAELERELAR